MVERRVFRNGYGHPDILNDGVIKPCLLMANLPQLFPRKPRKYVSIQYGTST